MGRTGQGEGPLVRVLHQDALTATEKLPEPFTGWIFAVKADDFQRHDKKKWQQTPHQ